MKHIEMVDLSKSGEPREQEFDLVLEELEERYEFGPITPNVADPGCSGGCGCCYDTPPLVFGGCGG